MEVNKEIICYILQFCFDKGKKANLVAEIVNAAYGSDTAHTQLCLILVS